jgi:DNA-binding winged helix-turn-helix (wHTH) protein
VAAGVRGNGDDRIELAREAPFRLAGLEIRPALRQLVRDDGKELVLEPRVMQVLVALARAKGGILSRDDLTRCCWDGRVVGEDAINRVISRLRRAAMGIGQRGFRIETITKVGYRLIEDEAKRPQDGTARDPRRRKWAMIAGAGAGAGVLAVGGFRAWRYFTARPGKG